MPVKNESVIAFLIRQIHGSPKSYLKQIISAVKNDTPIQDREIQNILNELIKANIISSYRDPMQEDLRHRHYQITDGEIKTHVEKQRQFLKFFEDTKPEYQFDLTYVKICELMSYIISLDVHLMQLNHMKRHYADSRIYNCYNILKALAKNFYELMESRHSQIYRIIIEMYQKRPSQIDYDNPKFWIETLAQVMKRNYKPDN